jgi:hypothetical protein
MTKLFEKIFLIGILFLQVPKRFPKQMLVHDRVCKVL